MLYDAKLLDPIHHFLACKTPQAWIDKASQLEKLAIILCDHLLCELKAAQSAMLLLRKYAVDEQSSDTLLQWLQPFEDFAYKKIGNINTLKGKNQLSKSIRGKKNTRYSQSLIDKMVLLIKEELHHFYQVLELMTEKDIKLSVPVVIAKGLFSHISHHEPNALIDKPIIGAYIETRSYERFAKLAPHLETPLAKFYISLLRSEFRHYQDYLVLAQAISSENIQQRIEYFASIKAELIETPDSDFKFHSGVPVWMSNKKVGFLPPY